MDRSSIRQAQKNCHSLHTLRQYIADFGLVDVCRCNNPTNKEFSYYSPVHKTWSRIDYFLVNNSCVWKIIETTIRSIVISHHAPVSITLMIDQLPITTPRWRFDTSLLKDKEFLSYFTQEWTTFMEINSTPEMASCTLWETAKAFMRGKIISYSTYKKKKENEEEKYLLKEVKRLEILVSKNPDEPMTKKTYGNKMAIECSI